MDLFKPSTINYDLFDAGTVHVRNEHNELVGYVYPEETLFKARNARTGVITCWTTQEAAINELLRQDERTKAQLSKVINNQISLF